MPITDAYTLLGAWPLAEVDLSVEALAAGMQARGITRSLVTHTTAIFYDQTLGNDQALQICAQHQPLEPVAVINPLIYPHCLAEIDRCLERGVKLFRLCPREHRYPFSGSVGPLRECLRRLEAAKLVLIDVVGLPAPVLTADIEGLIPTPTAFSVDGAGLGTVLAAGHQNQNIWVETSQLTEGGAREAAVQHLSSVRFFF